MALVAGDSVLYSEDSSALPFAHSASAVSLCGSANPAAKDLWDAYRYRRQRTQWREAEWALLDLLRFWKARHSALVVYVLKELKRLYRKWFVSLQAEVVAEVNQLLSDSAFPRKTHWKVYENTAVLFVMWGNIEKGKSLLQKLSTHIHSIDTLYWAKIQLKIACLYKKEKQFSQAHDVLWAAFVDLKPIATVAPIAVKVASELLRVINTQSSQPSTDHDLATRHLRDITLYTREHSNCAVRSVIDDYSRQPLLGYGVLGRGDGKVLVAALRLMRTDATDSAIGHSYYTLIEMSDRLPFAKYEVRERLARYCLAHKDNLQTGKLRFVYAIFLKSLQKQSHWAETELGQIRLLNADATTWAKRQAASHIRLLYASLQAT